MRIPYELKKECVLARQYMTAQQVYQQIFAKHHSDMTLRTFRRRLLEWQKKIQADTETLMRGTYNGFTAYGATVQVDSDGNIRQAWIKQSNTEIDTEQILAAIEQKIIPVHIEKAKRDNESCMLELPLFDMHFGVATIDDYRDTISDIIELIGLRYWDEINIIIGQDLLHTNDLRGHTAKGTDICVIDFGAAWADAFAFWCSIIEHSLKNARTVRLRYSKGNHDECASWCLLKALSVQFPDAVIDDSFAPRKCIHWKGCFIGYGHCQYTGNLDTIFRNFVTDFPTEVANSSVREIHTGHLHRESQDNGMMVRRLASAVPTDGYSTDNGFVGSNKRFQVFEWRETRLKAIHYV